MFLHSYLSHQTYDFANKVKGAILQMNKYQQNTERLRTSPKQIQKVFLPHLSEFLAYLVFIYLFFKFFLGDKHVFILYSDVFEQEICILF